jgi:hypothetical protein
MWPTLEALVTDVNVGKLSAAKAFEGFGPRSGLGHGYGRSSCPVHVCLESTRLRNNFRIGLTGDEHIAMPGRCAGAVDDRTAS